MTETIKELKSTFFPDRKEFRKAKKAIQRQVHQLDKEREIGTLGQDFSIEGTRFEFRNIHPDGQDSPDSITSRRLILHIPREHGKYRLVFALKVTKSNLLDVLENDGNSMPEQDATRIIDEASARLHNIEIELIQGTAEIEQTTINTA